MNATTQEILRQICTGGPCPQTSVRASAPQAMMQTPSELIGQIIHPHGAPTAANSVASPPRQGA